jgi:hypothetical protein
MKYLLLCCHEEKKLDSMSKSECDAIDYGRDRGLL